MKTLLASALALLITTGLAHATVVPANQSKDSTLLAALRHGGCVILMRHASSPSAPPTAGRAASGNGKLERQLDGQGIADARAMGNALRQMGIPIGEVMSSPTFRARETIAAAGLRPPRTVEQLGDAGRSMNQRAVASWSKWLRRAVSQPPAAGSNALIVTQMPNISDAYGRPASALKAGGALVFRPDGHGDAQMLAVMQIGDWKQLAAQFKR
jgi:phosphohistidine phosphatase SixA